MKNEANTISAVLAAAMGILASYFMKLMIPVLVLAVMMGMDYFTGVAKAWVKGGLSSKVGLIGFLKKVGYLVIIAVAGVIDWLFAYGLESVGIDYKLPFLFAAIVTIWLILNECISILENVAAIGGPVPPFITKLLKHVKGTVEQKADAAADLKPDKEPEKEQAEPEPTENPNNIEILQEPDEAPVK